MSRAASVGSRIIQPIRGIGTAVKGSFAELRLVTWPSREQAIQYTSTVVISVLVVAGMTAALDYGLTKLVEQIIAWSQRV